ncbi:hypothetical protein JK358_37290 [Nocardia sp. 2]|uniref:DUF3137 domain-containing protein n=1 Tax=Nocardia acididurans TaxID=2802282 RepID=A0ABS1MHC2_9NOCA|nr:hypothetical protein [Nocardia acididurans]MBL1080067.1 hypothetical protein [Nocardia acididurans]
MEFFLASMALPLLVVVAAVVLGVANAGLRQKARRLEMARMHQWAQRNGLHYTPGDNSIAALSAHAPFGIGSNRVGHNVFRGTHRGRAMIFGEYRYTVKNNKSTVVHPWQFVALAMPAPRPWLNLRRDHGGLFSRPGRKGLLLESQEFNERFRIDTASERFAYDVLSPRTMEWLLADARADTVGFRFEGQWAITVRAGTLNPDEVWFYAEYLHDVIGLVPDFVWRY